LPPEQRTPLVELLLNIINNQSQMFQEEIHKLKQENQKLNDEIARLNKRSQRPKIPPSRLESGSDKRRGKTSKKRKKRKKKATLTAHRTQVLEAENVPEGSKFKGYDEWMVQDIRFESFNTRYKLARWVTPDGREIRGQLPPEVDGQHFGPTLRSFILHQHHDGRVTQRSLFKLLNDIGVDISKSQINRILVNGHERYHSEKQDLLRVGLQVSGHVTTDDTSSRHHGKNGYCTHIGNELFAFFASTESKSRRNFLELLRIDHKDYVINPEAVAYMQHNGLAQKHLRRLQAVGELIVPTVKQLNTWLQNHGIVKPKAVQICTEGAMVGSLLHHGFNPNLVIVSDDAGQFNVLLHALCWIHADRGVNKLKAFTPDHQGLLDATRRSIWQLYDDLKAYKEQPTAEQKEALRLRFDTIFDKQTCWDKLNKALERFMNNKEELLRVLDFPDIPLHQNGSERDIREHVQRRKISGSTRSERGRQCRDTFLSLKKTCRKLGISFWDYLTDRVFQRNDIPPLSELVRQRALAVPT
jgi:hypothetical protein